MKPITCLLIAFMACMLSCKKDKSLNINEDSLTGCPTNATCQNMFTEHADLSIQEKLTTGNFRVFWASTQYPGVRSTIYIKAPMTGNEFKLTGEDIRAGKAFVSSSCASCLSVAYAPVDGEIKGINTTPGIQADKSKWLIEAKIIRSAAWQSNSRDTFYVKQYFYPNFIYN